MSQKQKNIILIGFMGVGKTTIGQELAEILQRSFVDLDQIIEKEAQKTIVEIFAQEGEASFRAKEREHFEHLMEGSGYILSLGGGAFLQDDIYRRSLKDGIVVFLDIRFQSWLKRLPLLIKDRPVLQNKSQKQIRELYNDRKKAYSQAHYLIPTDSLRPKEAAIAIKKTIQGA